LALGQHTFFSGGRRIYFWKEGYTNSKKMLKDYAEAFVLGIQSGLFAFGAHPDIFANFYAEWDEDAKACARYILEAAKSYEFPLEINGNGFRKGLQRAGDQLRYFYPIEPFWALAAKYDISVLVNSDAHEPWQLRTDGQGMALAKKFDLNVIDLRL
jgi:histidinol-phosphatase (PHP family)